MFATGETMGLAEWIIDDTYLVFLKVRKMGKTIFSYNFCSPDLRA